MGDGFKHITVTSAEDEDEVIVAGVVGEGAASAPLAPAPAVADAPALAPAPSPAPASAPSPNPARDFAPASRRSPARSDAYRETTLADLEDSHMPLAQKVVIVAAIVCIIGALCYYFAVMR